MLELPYYVPSNFPKIFVLVCTLELLSRKNPNISGTILKKRNSRRPSNMFPRVKTPAAYVRVPCYPPARFSNFVKDFLAGAYYWTSKESKHVFGFCWRKARLWECCSMSPYVLGILAGGAMLWFDI